MFAPKLVQGSVPGGGQRAEKSLAGGALEDSATSASECEGLGEAEQRCEPVHDDGLELGGGGGGHPVEAHDAEAGAEHLAEEAGGAAAGREVGEVVGALPVSEPGENVVSYVSENGF